MDKAPFVLASAIFLIAFVLYNRDFLQGKTTPVFSPWPVFTLTILVNCLTYVQWTADWVNIMVYGTDFVICALTAMVIWIRMKGDVQVTKLHKWAALASLAAILAGILAKSEFVGNILNLFAYSLAWIPIYQNVWEEPSSEPTLPWRLWTYAFVLNIIALYVNPKTQPMDYAAPVVCLVHHGAITLLSLRKINR